MARKCYFHRNIIEAEVAYGLMGINCLTFSEKERNRQCFENIKKGDLIVVPSWGRFFDVYEACEPAKNISLLEKEWPELPRVEWHRIIWKDHRIYDEREGRFIDIDLFLPVKKVGHEALQEFCINRIRLPYRTITDIRDIDISDLICDDDILNLIVENTRAVNERLPDQIWT